MIDVRKKFVARLFPLVGMTIFALIAVIKSFEKQEIWHILLSSGGLLVFIVLTSLFVYRNLRDGNANMK
jgi:uncharacterized membrane protein